MPGDHGRDVQVGGSSSSSASRAGRERAALPTPARFRRSACRPASNVRNRASPFHPDSPVAGRYSGLAHLDRILARPERQGSPGHCRRKWSFQRAGLRRGPGVPESRVDAARDRLSVAASTTVRASVAVPWLRSRLLVRADDWRPNAPSANGSVAGMISPVGQRHRFVLLLTLSILQSGG